MTDTEPDLSLISALAGPVRLLRQSARDPLELTLLERAGMYDLQSGRRNANGRTLLTRVVVGLSLRGDALCAHLEPLHWIVIFEKILLTVDEIFATLAGISNDAAFFSPSHRFDGSRLSHPPGFRWRVGAKGPGLADAADANKLFAGYMAYCALRYVADHEFFHAVHGHVLLIEELFDAPTIAELARRAAPREQDIRLSLEMEADRSAVTQLLVDIVEGQTPTNNMVEGLSIPDQLSMAIVAVALVIGFWETEEIAFGDETMPTHPSIGTRLHMLLGPTLERALGTAGLSAPAVDSIVLKISHALVSLARVHSVLAAPLRALEESRNQYYRTENQRLEMVYRLDVAHFLRRLHF
jgi:hypothetical protein